MKLTTVLLTSLLITLSPVALKAQTTTGFFETQSRLDDRPQGNLVLDIGVDRLITKKVSIAAFFLTTGGWAEGYIGPTLQATDWLNVGFSIGGEQSGGVFRLRYANTTWLGVKQFSFLGFVEANNATFQKDDSGLWYDLNLRYQPEQWLTIGLKDRRNRGFGPSVQVQYQQVKIWMAWTPLNLETGVATPAMLLSGVVLVL